jgi:sulfite reductase beta subunit-like hemoprotein
MGGSLGVNPLFSEVIMKKVESSEIKYRLASLIDFYHRSKEPGELFNDFYRRSRVEDLVNQLSFKGVN